MEVIGVLACVVLIVGAIMGTIALVNYVFDAWREIRNLRIYLAEIRKDQTELSKSFSMLAIDVATDKADQVDLEELAAGLTENDAAIERLVEDFDESDQETASALEEADSRLTTHNTFILDIGARLEALESATKRKGR